MWDAGNEQGNERRASDRAELTQIDGDITLTIIWKE